MMSQFEDFFVYLTTETGKNRSFGSNYVSLKQKLNAMNDILTLYRLYLCTFAAEIIHKSTNNLTDQQWNN